MVGILLFPMLAVLFIVIGATRPGPNRLFRGRHRRQPRARFFRPDGPDPTAGLRDPARPF